MAEPVWVVIPAAGTGSRFGGEVPKQYLRLAGVPVLHHALRAATRHPEVAGAMVVLAAGDPHWRVPAELPLACWTTTGGATRAASVMAGLRALLARPEVRAEHWVLVHDAARPCLAVEDLQRLLLARRDYPEGAILAAPINDTVKRVDAHGQIEATVDRRGLYRALTPQLFPAGLLLQALLACTERGEQPGDEAAAMEAAGHRPGVVPGRADNIKITHPRDLALVERTLCRAPARQGHSASGAGQ